MTTNNTTRRHIRDGIHVATRTPLFGFGVWLMATAAVIGGMFL